MFFSGKEKSRFSKCSLVPSRNLWSFDFVFENSTSTLYMNEKKLLKI